MKKRFALAGVMVVLVLLMANPGAAQDLEVLGVTFPGTKVVAGKTLTLNGVAYRKALGFVKVYVSGLYLEKKTTDAVEVIESEQVKHLYTHYLTSKATAKKLQEGFIDLIEKCNPPDMVKAHQEQIQQYAGWLDKDM
jgi:hypothetical protein